MIEIKNKRMLVFPDDRIIGAQGDLMTAERKFILERVQDGYDLSDMICFIKLDPETEPPFEQLVQKEIKGDKIILTWILGGACMKYAGEISAQIIFVGKDYFDEKDLANLDEHGFVVPHRVIGNSAPVWQSHKESFIITESIDNTGQYVEVTKNVLLSALADAANHSQKAQGYSQSAKTSELNAKMHSTDANEAKKICLSYLEETQAVAQSTEEKVDQAAQYASDAAQEKNQCEQILQSAKQYSETSARYSEITYVYTCDAHDVATRVADAEKKINELNDNMLVSADSVESSMINTMIIESEVQIMQEEITQICDEARICAEMTEESVEKAEQFFEELQRARDYRLIYSKTLTQDDTGCISFEINQDIDGGPLSLSECVFYIYCPKTEGAQGSYVKIEGLSEGNSSFARLSQISLVSANSDVYCRAECLNRGRWIVKTAKGTSWDQNAESVTAQGAVCAQSRANDGKPLKAVRLVQHSNVGVPFEAGMTVELWGVDSIKEEA